MISDQAVLNEIRLSWHGAEKLRERLRREAFGSMGVIGGRFPFALADVAHNLPFMQAYSVLNDVLDQLRAQGRFSCSSRFLGPLVRASETALPWLDFSLIATGVSKRNQVAHDAIYLSRKECWDYMNAIERELAAWKVI